MRLNRPWFVTLALIASVVAVLPGAPASADRSGAEYLYAPTDPYLSQRVQEVTDTSDVLLAVEWEPTTNGVVDGVRICLDLTQQQVNNRLPLTGDLWTSDGDLLGVAGASEGITFTAPCFYDLTMNQVLVSAGQRYVVGVWVRGGQYSYVPGGFATGRSNCGHVTAPSNVDSTVGSGNGLYAYTSDMGEASPFPVDSWQDSDYLVSPRFTPFMP
jgi:hypothetical protein